MTSFINYLNWFLDDDDGAFDGITDEEFDVLSVKFAAKHCNVNFDLLRLNPMRKDKHALMELENLSPDIYRDRVRGWYWALCGDRTSVQYDEFINDLKKIRDELAHKE